MRTLLEESSFSELLGAIAAKSPTPGGGAVASVTGATSAALAQMVVNYSIGKKKLAEHEPALKEAVSRLEKSRAVLLELAEEDASAYGAVNELMKLPEDDAKRAGELPAAARAAARVPLSTMAACVNLLRLYESLAPITNRFLHSDLAIAAVLADAAVRASRCNVEVNLPLIRRVCGEADAAELEREAGMLLTASRDLLTRIEETRC